MVGIMKEKLLEILEIHLSVIGMGQFTNDGSEQSGLGGYFQLNEHGLDVIDGQSPLLLAVKLVEYLPQDKFLVSAISSLQ